MSLPVQLRYITGVTVRSLVKPVLKNFPKVNIRTSLWKLFIKSCWCSFRLPSVLCSFFV